mmetsp:Transcript_24336/g.62452  ORF Transcript_24336/g.62452 Transcript_24336/m.62452 type:complete len:214 (+) Transcript_24336:630-1271(+)
MPGGATPMPAAGSTSLSSFCCSARCARRAMLICASRRRASPAAPPPSASAAAATSPASRASSSSIPMSVNRRRSSAYSVLMLPRSAAEGSSRSMLGNALCSKTKRSCAYSDSMTSRSCCCGRHAWRAASRSTFWIMERTISVCSSRYVVRLPTSLLKPSVGALLKRSTASAPSMSAPRLVRIRLAPLSTTAQLLCCCFTSSLGSSSIRSGVTL